MAGFEKKIEPGSKFIKLFSIYNRLEQKYIKKFRTTGWK